MKTKRTFTTPAAGSNLDRVVNAWLGRFTHGLSPASLLFAYLDWLMGEFDNDPLMVIAAYNAGEGAVRNNGGVPPYAETRDYVPKVLAAWQVAQGLCVSAPMLVSDPCVFRTDLAGG